jgi:chaperonin cofactor prefoldin
MKQGILNMQGKIFKNQCRLYLAEDYKISLAEYESLEEDHSIYNALGGNHDGDALFAMVEEKIKKDLSE